MSTETQALREKIAEYIADTFERHLMWDELPSDDRAWYYEHADHILSLLSPSASPERLDRILAERLALASAALLDLHTWLYDQGKPEPAWSIVTSVLSTLEASDDEWDSVMEASGLRRALASTPTPGGTDGE